MQCVQRNRTIQASRHTAQGLFVLFAASLGGCSADVTRFEFPAFNLTEGSTGALPTSEPVRRTPTYADGPLTTARGTGLNDEAARSQPKPYPYQGQGGYQGGGYQGQGGGYGQGQYQGQSQGGGYGQTQGQGQYQAQGQYQGGGQGQYQGQAQNAGQGYQDQGTRDRQVTAELTPEPDRYGARTAERRADPVRQAGAGEAIEVQPGDTLFGIAKRYNVPVAALMEANGLSYGASIKAGQRLNLPGASSARGGQEFGRAPERRAVPAKETVSADAPVWNGHYTMNPGDSLYSIARNHQTTLADLQRANGITDPTKVRAGTVLIVPGKGEAASDRSASTGSPQTNTTQTTTTGGPRVVHIPLGQTQTHSQTTGMGEGSKIASRGDTVSDATEAAAPSSGARFRWPVTGRVLAGFGKRPDGSHNDGINLAVQQGTEVRAAEGGRVVYAGSELKGYGNLVLIRHDNGWVTAYAHNEELLVKRDEAVKRGQVIAKAGRTGNVDQAQLHFELRQGAKPIDPMPYLDRN